MGKLEGSIELCSKCADPFIKKYHHNEEEIFKKAMIPHKIME